MCVLCTCALQHNVLDACERVICVCMLHTPTQSLVLVKVMCVLSIVRHIQLSPGSLPASYYTAWWIFPRKQIGSRVHWNSHSSN